MEANQLKLYSISAAAKLLCLGKDSTYRLVSEGKIGYIEIGKRKKIPYQELVRFQNEGVKRIPIRSETLITKNEVEKIFHLNRKKGSLNGKEILQSIMRQRKWQV